MIIFLFIVDGSKKSRLLSSASAQRASLPLEGIDNIHGSDGLPLGVLGIGGGIPDQVLKDKIRSEYTMRIGKINAHICAYISAYLHRNHSESENISAYVDIRTAYVHIHMKPHICGINMASSS